MYRTRGGNTYRHILNASFLKHNFVIGDVDKEMSVPSTDAAIALCDGAFGIRERRGNDHAVFDSVAETGAIVGLASGSLGFLGRGCVGHCEDRNEVAL
jgi:hypothetical protein